MKIGVLALQGDFDRHGKALARVKLADGGVEAAEVRKTSELDGLDGLVIPGGESTTLLKLMDHFGFWTAMAQFHAVGKPIFGTCAGAILIAREVENPAQRSLDFIDIGVERNAYGRQRESFEARGEAALDRPREVEMVFIRAPRIRRVGGDVAVLARHQGEPVMVRQGAVLASTFHPELTDDPSIHEYFCAMVQSTRKPT